MTGPAVAFALSVRDWPDRVHRFLLDHGGARVAVPAFRPEDLTSEPIDVLLIDDICSFLTPGLVADARRKGITVLGVYDPEEPDGKSRLVECGVVDVVETDADPDEFLQRTIAAWGGTERAEPPAEATRVARPIYTVVGAGGGVGATEVAVALARRLATRAPTVLVDAHPTRPSVAQRLGLDLHPNLWTAIDLVEQRDGDPVDATLQVGPLRVLPGMPPASVHPLAPHRLGWLLGRLASRHVVVVDAGPVSHLPSSPVGVVAVGGASPVGLTRLISDAAGLRRPHLVVNRCPRGGYRRSEIVGEVARALTPASLILVPDDPRVLDAAWEGRWVEGRFRRVVDRWVDTYLAGAR